jgi:penicillin-binding protein 1A
VAGKTGTAAENHDDWFVGNTPKYSAAVWIGSDADFELSEGSSASLTVWNKVMRQIVAGQEGGSFPEPPSNVVRTSVSGLTDYFIRGTEPEKIMFGSETVDICLDSMYRATTWCPNQEPREFNMLNGDGGSTPPEFYCHLHNINPGQFPIDPSESLDTTFDPDKPNVPDPLPDPPLTTGPPVNTGPPISTSPAGIASIVTPSSMRFGPAALAAGFTAHANAGAVNRVAKAALPYNFYAINYYITAQRAKGLDRAS